MSILHTVNKSPFERNNLDSCLDHANAGDTILLIEDAVVAAVGGTKYAARIAETAKTVKVCALISDLKGRGFGDATLVEGVTTVDYTGFVELAAENHAVNAWL